MLTHLILDILNDRLDEEGLEVLRSSWGITLSKSETDTNKVRPIAMGEDIMKLAARIALSVNETELKAAIHKDDFGCGRKCGAETVVHITRTLMRQQKSLVFVKLDARNAFNALRRETIREALRERTPSLLAFFRARYGNGNHVFFPREDEKGEQLDPLEIFQKEGIAQGCPMSPAIFTVTMSWILHKVRERFPRVRFLTYLDDITVIARSATEARAALAALKEAFGTRGNPGFTGMVLNDGPSGKCVAFCPQGFSTEDTQILTDDGLRVSSSSSPFTLLGACVSEAAAEFFQQKLEDFELVVERFRQVVQHVLNRPDKTANRLGVPLLNMLQ